MDAYSYLYRGQVFANAQTGNILLFGVNIACGDIASAVKYLWPVLAFIAGVILSDIIKRGKYCQSVQWRQISVMIEIIILAVVAFLPLSANSVANGIISFACGIQVESFRILCGNSIATTMCIGNLRSGTYNLNRYFVTKEPAYLKRTFLYFGIIVSFVCGAVIESGLISVWGHYAILLSPALLMFALLLMFFDTVYYEDDFIE